MGNRISYGLPNVCQTSRKRKNVSFNSGSDENDSDDNESTPKRRKLMCTTKYIYKTLFEEGQGSDVKIVALNKEWNLHRVYLSQVLNQPFVSLCYAVEPGEYKIAFAPAEGENYVNLLVRHDYV